MTEKIFIAKESTSQQILEKLGGRIVVSSETTEDSEKNLLKPLTRDSLNKVETIYESLESGDKDIKFSDDGKYAYLYTVTGTIYSINLENFNVLVFNKSSIPVSHLHSVFESNLSTYNQGMLVISGNYLFFYISGAVCKINRFTMQLVESVFTSFNQSNHKVRSIAVANDMVHLFTYFTGSTTGHTYVKILNCNDLSTKLEATAFKDINNQIVTTPFLNVVIDDSIYLMAGDGSTIRIYKLTPGVFTASAVSPSISSIGANTMSGKKYFITNDDNNIYLLNFIISIDITTLSVNLISNTSDNTFKSIQKVVDKYFITKSSTLYTWMPPDGEYTLNNTYEQLFSRSSEPIPGEDIIIYLSDDQYLIVSNTELALYEKTKNIVAWRVVE